MPNPRPNPKPNKTTRPSTNAGRPNMAKVSNTNKTGTKKPAPKFLGAGGVTRSAGFMTTNAQRKVQQETQARSYYLKKANSFPKDWTPGTNPPNVQKRADAWNKGMEKWSSHLAHYKIKYNPKTNRYE